MAGSYTIVKPPPQNQVFISYHDIKFRNEFISHLHGSLKSNKMNVYSRFLGNDYLMRFGESGIALVILSKKYSESIVCLEELMKIKDCVEKGKLVAYVIYYKLEPTTVQKMLEAFGDAFWWIMFNVKKKRMEDAFRWISRSKRSMLRDKILLRVVPAINGSTKTQKSYEHKTVKDIVEDVKKFLKGIPLESISSEGITSESIPSEGILSEGIPSESIPLESIIPSESIPSEGIPSESIPSEGSQKSSRDLCYGSVSHLVEAWKSYEFRCHLGVKIGCLLLLFFIVQQIAYMSIGLIYQGGAMKGTMENEQKVQEYIPTEGTENPLEKYFESPIGEVGAEPDSSTSDAKTNDDFLDSYPGSAKYGIVENVKGVQEYIPREITNNPIHNNTEFPIGEVGAKPGSSTSDAKTNDNILDRTYTNCPMDSQVKPPQIQVFINFRGDQLRNNFVGYLVDALRRSKINVFIDNHALRGEDLNTLFKRIEDSGIAIVVFSSRYTESKWCLEELVKIKERVLEGQLKVLPIFYKVTVTNVKKLKGDFGDHFRDMEYTYGYDEAKIKRWKEAIALVSHKFGISLDEKSSVLEIDFVEIIIKEVLKILLAISTVESIQASR